MRVKKSTGTVDWRSRNVCFTLNNYTPEEEEHIKALDLKYLVFGHEVSSTGTPHLQGNAVSHEALSFTQWKKRLGERVHVEQTKSKDPTLASGYCRKDGDFFEKGREPKPGERIDLQEMYDRIKRGEIDKQWILDNCFPLYCQYGTRINEALERHKPKPKVKDITLMPWQEKIVEILKGPVHDRHIHFVVDYEGGRGKSTFRRYLCATFEDVANIRAGREQDMGHQIKIDCPKIALIDVERDKFQFFSYTFVEALKNGEAYKPKFESTNMQFDPPHVVVFCNQRPDMEKLSKDRFVIHDITECPTPDDFFSDKTK